MIGISSSCLAVNVASSNQTCQARVRFLLGVTLVWQNISQIVALSDPSEDIIVEIKKVIGEGVQFVLRIAPF